MRGRHRGMRVGIEVRVLDSCSDVWWVQGSDLKMKVYWLHPCLRNRRKGCAQGRVIDRYGRIIDGYGRAIDRYGRVIDRDGRVKDRYARTDGGWVTLRYCRGSTSAR